MNLAYKLLITAAATGLLASVPASAAPILGLYNTGVDANGNKLADGSVDTHYLVNGAATFTTSNAAYITSATASYIASQPNGQGGNATYSLVFDLGSLNPATATLSGKTAYDNGVTIFLNGFQLYSDQPGGYPAFQVLHDFAAPSADFVAGFNTLTFEVTDYGLPTGLLVADLVGTGAVPEPATWAMMLAGFGMIGFAARRRQSVKTTVRFA